MVRHVRTSLWFVPVTCVVFGVGLSLATVAIDRSTDFTLIPESFTGGPDVAIAILSTVAASMVSLAALVLTITMVVVQLAMGQFSPRIVQTFLQDKPSQIAIGLFVATFAHSVVALREVRDDDVPGLAIVVAFILVLASIMVLVLYVHHIGRSLRVASLIELVGGKTRRVLDVEYPSQGPVEDDRSVIPSPRSGVISHVGHDELVEVARKGDCTLELVVALGEFVPAGAPLFRVHGDSRRVDREAAVDALMLGLERTLDQDVAYGLRLLVDIAQRSLADSPFQDPTTAVQAIDRLHDCLRQLATRPFPDGVRRDTQGAVRLIVPAMTWDDYVELAFEEIRMVGAPSPQVTRRLRSALEDLLVIAPPARQEVLRRHIDLLETTVRERVSDPRDVVTDLTADRLGFGVGTEAGA